MTTETTPYRFKICLMGDAGVGKTSLVNRVTAGIFDERYLSTVGLRVETAKLQIDGNPVELGLWDLAGGMENRALVRSGYSGAAGVFVVIDPTRPQALRAALEYALWMREAQPEALCCWIFNKADLQSDWRPENAPEYICNAPHFVTSAKTGAGVENAFHEMARQILSRMTLLMCMHG